MSKLSEAFSSYFFMNETNRFSGSGGEVLVKGPDNTKAPATRIDIGDYLIGIGIAHTVESLSRTPGPESFNDLVHSAAPAKMAARGLQVTSKEKADAGYKFALSPIPPKVYSSLLADVSNGAVEIPAHTIPEGTMVMSFLNEKPDYTLQAVKSSPAVNWRAATSGERHWNVGVRNREDFWEASFPFDDISMMAKVPPWVKIGSIRFGLSLLPGSQENTKFEPVPAIGALGETSKHHFSLAGHVVGTAGLDTPFPISLRTEIIFRPVR